MMGEKQYLNDLEKNLKEQQVKERLEDVRNQEKHEKIHISNARNQHNQLEYSPLTSSWYPFCLFPAPELPTVLGFQEKGRLRWEEEIQGIPRSTSK